MTELTNKISEYEEETKQLIAQADAAAPPTPSEGDQPEEDTDASDDETDDEFEDRFVDLEEDLANVIADVHDLGTFWLGQSHVAAGDCSAIVCNRCRCSRVLDS